MYLLQLPQYLRSVLVSSSFFPFSQHLLFSVDSMSTLLALYGVALIVSNAVLVPLLTRYMRERALVIIGLSAQAIQVHCCKLKRTDNLSGVRAMQQVATCVMCYLFLFLNFLFDKTQMIVFGMVHQSKEVVYLQVIFTLFTTISGSALAGLASATVHKSDQGKLQVYRAKQTQQNPSYGPCSCLCSIA